MKLNFKRVISLLLCMGLLLMAAPFSFASPPYVPTPTVQWVLDLIDGIDIAANGYGQYDEIWTVKTLLAPNRTTIAQASRLTSAEKAMFTDAAGIYHDKYELMLDMDAQIIKLWLEEFCTQLPGETWQDYFSRIMGVSYSFTEAPGFYRSEDSPNDPLVGVEPSRRVSVLGADDFYNSVYGIYLSEMEEELSERFHDECYVPAKAVEKMIDEMDPAVEADVLAARAAYDELDLLSRGSIMNYDLLTKAEGTYGKPDNLKKVGMRKPTGADTGFTASQHKAALDYMQDILPGTTPWYIWISGVASGEMRIGLPNTDPGWAALEASGVLTHPVQYYKDMGISLNDTIGPGATGTITVDLGGGATETYEGFFEYLDSIPGSEVYLQVENMWKPIEPEIDVLHYLALQYDCIKGFAIDIEWYNHGDEDCGLPITDYRARKLNEYIYETWGPEYSLAIKHYDSTHMPATYRGGNDGKSNPIIFINDSQGDGSLDGTHGGIYSEPTQGQGNFPGTAGIWTMFANFCYPNPVIFQTGYAPDRQWTYGFDDPLIQTYGIKLAEVTAPDQDFGVAWVNFNREGYREFPGEGVSSLAQKVTATVNVLNSYFGNYNGTNNHLIGGAFGYNNGSAAGRSRLDVNYAIVWDALVVRNLRVAIMELEALGANTAAFYSNGNYGRFTEMESKAVAIRIMDLPAIADIGMKDYDKIMKIWDTYQDLTSAQQDAIGADLAFLGLPSDNTLEAQLIAAYDKVEALAQEQYTVTFKVEGGGSIVGAATGDYPYTLVGDEIDIEAVPKDSNWEFFGWQLDGGGYILDKSSAQTQLRVSGDGITVTAVFMPLARISINGPDSVVSGANTTASYTISATDIPPLSGIQFSITVDGSFLSSKEFFIESGFKLLSTGNYGTPLFWTNTGNVWTGKAILINDSAIAPSGDFDIFTMVFNVAEGKLGDTDVVLNYAKLSFAGNPVAALIGYGVATTTFEQWYSRYDLNKDNVIDLNDITFALQYLTITDQDAEWAEAYVCDLNDSKTIDIGDLILILANYTIPYYS